jgi:hypothetical protein
VNANADVEEQLCRVSPFIGAQLSSSQLGAWDAKIEADLEKLPSLCVRLTGPDHRLVTN